MDQNTRANCNIWFLLICTASLHQLQLAHSQMAAKLDMQQPCVQRPFAF